jgi:hypothetical protein
MIPTEISENICQCWSTDYWEDDTNYHPPSSQCCNIDMFSDISVGIILPVVSASTRDIWEHMSLLKHWLLGGWYQLRYLRTCQCWSTDYWEDDTNRDIWEHVNVEALTTGRVIPTEISENICQCWSTDYWEGATNRDIDLVIVIQTYLYQT